MMSRRGSTGRCGNSRTGRPFIVVLGHPGYYPRFGFRPASRYRIVCQWEAPEQAFMILALEEWKLQEVSGLARYRPEFNSVT